MSPTDDWPNYSCPRRQWENIPGLEDGSCHPCKCNRSDPANYMYPPIMLLLTWACYADDWSNTAATRKKHPISKNRNNVFQTRILIWNIFLYQPTHTMLYLIYKADLTRPSLPGRVDSGRLDPRPTRPGFLFRHNS